MGLYGFNTNDTNALLNRISRIQQSIPVLRSGAILDTGNNDYSVVSVNALSGVKIDLTQDGVDALGSIPPLTGNGPFAIVADTANTKATIYWDGTNGSSIPIVRRADNTAQPVPGSSQPITGLVASTWYGFLPYWSPSNACTIGWATGDSGTPAFLFAGGTGASFVPTATGSTLAIALQKQSLQPREALTAGFATFQMPASGSSSGGAGGGGMPGACVMNGTEIEPLGPIRPEDWKEERLPEQQWMRLITHSGFNLNCTCDHPLFEPDRGKTRADWFKSGKWLMTERGLDRLISVEMFRRACVKIKVRMKYGHLYFANGLLSSNAKIEANVG